MIATLIIIFIALCVALALTTVDRGKPRMFARAARLVVIAATVAAFGYWFFQRSFAGLREDALSVQVINRLPQPMDFYSIRVNKDGNLAKHLGVIRPDYYRIEYFNMEDSDEFWLVGFLGNDRVAYFSQHRVLNKNEDQLVEVNNYINQSQKLSTKAARQIAELQATNVREAIWVTLDLLLLFLNTVLFLRRKAK